MVDKITSDIKLGETHYSNVWRVRFDTGHGDTVELCHYEEAFAEGKEEGLGQGYDQGYEEGLVDGREEGIQTEYDRFWDTFQRNGNRREYASAFGGGGWTSAIFQPKYDIICTGDCRRIFSDNGNSIDLIDQLEAQNVILDTSGATNLQEMFRYNGFTRIPEINTVGCSSLPNLLYYPPRLWYIENIVLRDDGSQTIDTMTTGASALTHLRISGTIGNNANFSTNPLDNESMKSVITHLKNYAGAADAGKKTLKLSDACWTALEADSTAPDGNTWRDYVETTLGWLT